MQYILGYIMLLLLALIGGIIIGHYYFSFTDGPSEYIYDAEHNRLVSNESDEKKSARRKRQNRKMAAYIMLIVVVVTAMYWIPILIL